ncbi:methyltransferase domain-containing protein [Maricaulis salignorans]|uniref:Thiopurine S-methyltransferase (TPMT) n=1 Tax=Maricaulis salignorans TaxID=144026 RepID=A0A1G9WRC5_9PROT|nr:methyltransferase domain-containing protein [Maricaulis salignorans]SDM86977.1 Thiopurine S-methyltransferase (TPMT) [Maricaulis salignorans]
MSEERSAFDWETRFAAEDTPWERPGLHPAMLAWVEAGELEPGARVIIPGCGRSPELGFLAARGLEVTGADLSATALAFQRQAVETAGHGAALLEGDVLAHRPDTPYDRVYEQTFLCAIPPRLRVDYERALCDWLRPGGHLLALFMQKDVAGGPPYGCALPAMRELFPAQRWIWPDDDSFIAWPHPSLTGKPELAGILVRR